MLNKGGKIFLACRCVTHSILRLFVNTNVVYIHPIFYNMYHRRTTYGLFLRLLHVCLPSLFRKGGGLYNSLTLRGLFEVARSLVGVRGLFLWPLISAIKPVRHEVSARLEIRGNSQYGGIYIRILRFLPLKAARGPALLPLSARLHNPRAV